MEKRNELIDEIKEELQVNPKIKYESDNIITMIKEYSNCLNNVYGYANYNRIFIFDKN